MDPTDNRMSWQWDTANDPNPTNDNNPRQQGIYLQQPGNNSGQQGNNPQHLSDNPQQRARPQARPRALSAGLQAAQLQSSQQRRVPVIPRPPHSPTQPPPHGFSATGDPIYASALFSGNQPEPYAGVEISSMYQSWHTAAPLGLDGTTQGGMPQARAQAHNRRHYATMQRLDWTWSSAGDPTPSAPRNPNAPHVLNGRRRRDPSQPGYAPPIPLRPHDSPGGLAPVVGNYSSHYGQVRSIPAPQHLLQSLGRSACKSLR